MQAEYTIPAEPKPTYYWRITRDKLFEQNGAMHEGDKSEAGTEGPRGCDSHMPTPQHFRMLDDDGEVYYYGVASEGVDFEPLDDFGTPNAGCTSIEYRELNPATGRMEWMPL